MPSPEEQALARATGQEDSFDAEAYRAEYDRALAERRLDRGSFLLGGRGGGRSLDPPLVAALLALRRRLIEEQGVDGAAELMVVDSAVLAFYHQLRVAVWVGDLAQ